MPTSSVERVLLWITKIALFIVPFVPLYIAQNMFFPYITGKAFVFRTLVEIAFFSWVWLAIFYERYRPRMSPLMWAVSAWVVIVFLATIFGVNPERSFWSNFERMEGMIDYLHLAAYFVVLAHVFRRKDWMVFLHCSVIAGLLQGAYALFQKLGYLASPQGGFRTDGTIGNPTYLAAYLMFVFAFCLVLWVYAKKPWMRYYLGAAAFFTLLVTYFTASRGPTVAILLGGVFASALYFFSMRRNTVSGARAKKIILTGFAVLIIVPLGLWLARDTGFVRGSEVLSRLTSLSFKERTITSRFTIWHMSFEGFKEHPLLGWGPENYIAVFSKYYDPALWDQEPWFDRSHNIIFDWLINAGILGLIAYFSILVTGAGMLWKNYASAREAADQKHAIALEYDAGRELHIAVIVSALFLGYVLQNFFVFDNIATYTSFFALLAFIQGTASAHREARQAPAPPSRHDGRASVEVVAMVSAVLLAMLLGTIYVVNVRPLMVNLHLLNALKAQSESNIQNAYDEYNKSFSYDAALGSVEIVEQYSRFALSAGASTAITPEFRTTILKRAIDAAQRVATDNPYDPREQLFLAILLTKVGLFNQALPVFDNALKLAPLKFQIYFELADAYLQMGNAKKAAEVMDDIYQKIGENFNAVGMNLVAVHILNGDQDLVDTLLKKNFGTVDVPDELLVRVYIAVKKYDRLLGAVKAIAAANPDRFDYAARVAATEQKLGNTIGALQTITDFVAKHPDAKAQGDGVIAQIRSGQALPL